jgi:tryptophan 2,3-dioxygenase
MSDQRASLTYSSYLALDEVLGAQHPRTDGHDELLFTVIHQVYELWFKQLLHDATHLQGWLEDGDTPHALNTL